MDVNDSTTTSLSKIKDGGIIKPIPKKKLTPFQSILAIAEQENLKLKTTVSTSAFDLYNTNNYFSIMKKIQYFLENIHISVHRHFYFNIYYIIKLKLEKSDKYNPMHYLQNLDSETKTYLMNLTYIDMIKLIQDFISNNSIDKHLIMFGYIDSLINLYKMKYQMMILANSLIKLSKLDGIPRTSNINRLTENNIFFKL
jgi:hypothetical protein